MLFKHTFKHGASRNKKIPVLPLAGPPPALFQQLKGASGYDVSGRCRHRRCKTQVFTPIITSLFAPYLLLPSRLLKFVHTRHGRIFVLVCTIFNTLALIPAVRNMQLGSLINQPRRLTLGSFVPLNRLKLHHPLTNIFVLPKTHPTFLRAPGTYARLIASSASELNLRLPNNRTLRLPPSSIGQLGINATHDWRHHHYGGAGLKIRNGLRPHVRMKAKNPRERIFVSQYTKQKRSLPPWKKARK